MKHLNLFLFSLLIVLSACSTDAEQAVAEANTLATLQFTVAGATRGARATSIDTYGVSVAVYPKAEDFGNVAWGGHIYNMQLTAANGNTGYYMPVNLYKLSCFAWSPYGNTNVIIPDADKLPSSGSMFGYRSPENVADQQDIMLASAVNIECPQTSPVPLKFSHILCDMMFSFRNNLAKPVTVKRITVTGFRDSAYFSPDGNGEFTDAGVTDGNLNGAAASVLTTNVVVAPGEQREITTASNHFFLIPSVLPAGTQMLDILVEIDGEESHLPYTLQEEKQFCMGNVYGFNLTTEREMEVIVNGITDWIQE